MKRRSVERWRELVDGQRDSGLSIRGYCSREQVSAASFYRWREILRLDGQPRTDSSASEPGAPFLDLGTLGRGEPRLELRVDLGGGVILQLSRG